MSNRKSKIPIQVQRRCFTCRRELMVTGPRRIDHPYICQSCRENPKCVCGHSWDGHRKGGAGRCEGSNGGCHCKFFTTTYPRGDVKVLGPSNNACDCEHAKCHPDGNCGAFDRNWLIEAYGIKQTVCMPCFEKVTGRTNGR